jgi:hypothetical protein
MLDAETVVSSGTMKVTCSREELTQKLAVVSRGVSTRTAVQILGGILLNAEAGRLTLAATDMELSLRASRGRARLSFRAGSWSTSRGCCPMPRSRSSSVRTRA